MKRAYLKKIFKILAAVHDTWILEQVYRCAVNMTRGTEYEETVSGETAGGAGNNQAIREMPHNIQKERKRESHKSRI